MNLRCIAIGLATACLAGCATTGENVVFVTKTSLGIDFETTPPSGSVAYDRVEGFWGPRFDNGAVPPVAASIFTNGSLVNRQIKQLYATGGAAAIVAQTGTPAEPTEDAYTGNSKPMFFGTSSVLGVKLAFGSGLDSMTLGYKRKEVSVIPVAPAAGKKKDGLFPSVIASFDTDVAATTATGTTVGVRQYFATGSAAERVAGYSWVRGQFQQQAAEALSQYRTDERLQTSAILDIVKCLPEVKDDKLAQVWKNAEELELFPANVYPALRTQPASDARNLYTRYVTIADASSQTRTGLLLGHRAFVCNARG